MPSTVAGQIADWVRGLAGDGALAKNYPAVANAISGGMDNAMQAFVETYADQAIDAALGDEEAAKTMFSKETFLNALESGLSGGASGALGGAVGTGLAKNTTAAIPAYGGRWNTTPLRQMQNRRPGSSARRWSARWSRGDAGFGSGLALSVA